MLVIYIQESPYSCKTERPFMDAYNEVDVNFTFYILDIWSYTTQPFHVPAKTGRFLHV